MKTYAILRRTAWENPGVAEQAVGRSDATAAQMTDTVHRLRTYVLGEGGEALGSVCIYQATDAAAVREHASRAGLPADEVIEVVDTLIVNPDPEPVAAQ
jgi:hypothetical protein